MRSAVVLVVVIIFFLISLTSSVAALYTYWWFAIFRPHEWVYGGLDSFRLPLVAAILLLAKCLSSKSIPKLDNPISLLILFLLLLNLLATFLNGCADSGLFIKTKTTFELFTLVLVVLISAEILKDKRIIFGLLIVIGASLAFHSGKGGIVALITGASYYGRSQLGGFLSGSNAYALSSGVVLFILIFLSQCFNQSLKKSFRGFNYLSISNNALFNRGMKYLFILLALGTFYNIIALSSRGSMIATLIGFCVFLALQKNRGKLLITISIVLTLLISFAPIPESYFGHIQSAFEDEEELDASAASRPYFWSISRDIALTHPLGVGTGCYPVYYNYFDRSDGDWGYYRSVHSSHFQVLSDTGYFGLVAWLLLIILTLWRLMKIRTLALKSTADEGIKFFYLSLSNALICAMVVFVVGGSFYELAYNELTWIIFGITIALWRLAKTDLKIRSLN
jgi:putative inorganic carbon (HCO3(-)) transporter